MFLSAKDGKNCFADFVGFGCAAQVGCERLFLLQQGFDGVDDLRAPFFLTEEVQHLTDAPDGGEGIGKRFLEMAVERARQDPGISAVYATIFADKPELSGLVKMFESYYFSRRCLLCNGETVFEYPITWWRTPKQED